MVETELRVLNNEAIRDGLLLPDDSPSERVDFNSQLGKDLSLMERLCYREIYDESLQKGHAPAIDVFKELYGYVPCKKEALNSIGVLVFRIRKKLGEKAIETRYAGLGHVATRANIVSKFPNK